MKNGEYLGDVIRFNISRKNFAKDKKERRVGIFRDN